MAAVFRCHNYFMFLRFALALDAYIAETNILLFYYMQIVNRLIQVKDRKGVG